MHKSTVAVIIGILFLALGYSVFTGFSSVVRAEHDLLMRLDALTEYYVSMDTDYVRPLITSGLASDAEAISLREISEKLELLAASENPDEKRKNLLAVQSSTIAFFSLPGLSEALSTDQRFKDWNTNASSRGRASQLVYDFNVALSLYNARLTTYTGRIARFWQSLENHSFLSTDGTEEAQTHVSF